MALDRRKRLREATIEEIKAIARRQMAEQGAANISLRGIARQMGISAPALYRYFASYDDLLTTLISDAYISLEEAMVRARNGVPDNEYGHQLQAIAYAYRGWAIMYPEDYLLIYGTPIPGYDVPMEVKGPREKRIWSVFFDVLTAAHQAGLLVLEDDFPEPSHKYQELQVHVQNKFDLDFGLPWLHHAIVTWTQLHGLIMAELTGRFQILGSEPFYLEVKCMVERLGLSVSEKLKF